MNIDKTVTMTIEKIKELTGGRLIMPEDRQAKKSSSPASVSVSAINAIAPLETAKEGEITFAVSIKLKEMVDKTMASAIILPEKWPYEIKIPAVLVADPYLAFAKIASWFYKKRIYKKKMGIMPGAVIGSDCKISKTAFIGDNAVIGDRVIIGDKVIIHPNTVVMDGCSIDKGAIIYPNVTLYPNTVIGKDCIIHAGAVIGSDGFGYAYCPEDGFIKIPQTGRVIIEDNCEIGANTTIDRATFDETVIKTGTKMDNLVQIAHNCKVGAHSVIVAQVGIAGSTKIGDGCMIGGQAGIVGHLSIGNRVKIGAQAGVAQDIEDNAIVSGSPAIPHRLWLRTSALIKRLPEMFKDIEKIKRLLKMED